MTIRLDVYHHLDKSLTDHQFTEILKELHKMSAELDRLTAAVTRNTSVDSSIVALVEGLAQQLRDMANSATELTDLKAAIVARADELEASSDAEAAAVVANTPATPTPPPAP